MESKLSEILNGAVAIPYSHELLSQLVTICRSYSSDNPIEKIDNCSLSFITDVVSEDFSDYVANSLQESNLELRSLPTNVIARLSLFSVYLTVIEEKDELNQHLYATMFMNAMIYAKGRWNALSNSMVIQEIYKFHISNYLSKHDTIGDVFTTSIINNIAESNTYYNDNRFNESELIDLQIIAKDAAFYRCDKLLNDMELLKISDPFDRVYNFVTKLVNSYQYLFYNYDVAGYITKSSNGEQKSKILSNILKGIKPASTEINTETSVLLRMINGEGIGNSPYLLQRKLNVIEFGLYLYYELLVERIIENKEA